MSPRDDDGVASLDAPSPEDDLWLDDSQQRVWRSWLHGAARIHDQMDADLRAMGLDMAEYEILVNLSEKDGRQCRMSELADLVHQSRSRLTHAISRMERQGLVERHSVPTDRRGVIARLTDDGLQLLEDAAPGHVATVRRVFVDVVDPADFEAVGRAMQAVLKVAD